MMQDAFNATMKLITGEEVLAQVCPTKENGNDFFVVTNPIVITEQMQLNHEKGIAMSGLVPKKWMMYSNDDMTIIYKQHVISISEMDKFGTDFYKKALIAAKCSSPIKRKVDSKKNTGYIGKLESFRKSLQDIFESSPDLTKE